MFETRRSIRKYKNIPIEKEKLDIIIRNTLYSPTAQNRKPWEFVVVQDKEKIEEISKTRALNIALKMYQACDLFYQPLRRFLPLIAMVFTNSNQNSYILNGHVTYVTLV